MIYIVYYYAGTDIRNLVFSSRKKANMFFVSLKTRGCILISFEKDTIDILNKNGEWKYLLKIAENNLLKI